MEENKLKIKNLEILKLVLIQRGEVCCLINKLLKDDEWLKENIPLLVYTLTYYPELCENPLAWQKQISEYRYQNASLIKECNWLIILLNSIKQQERFYLDFAAENIFKRFSFENGFDIFLDYRHLAKLDEVNFIDLTSDIDNPFSKKNPVDLLISYNHFLSEYPALFSSLIPKMERRLILANDNEKVQIFDKMPFAHQKIIKARKSLEIKYHQLSDYARIYHGL